MSNLLQDNCTVITKHSLNNFLNYLRDSLRKTEQSYKSNFIFYDAAVDSFDQESQKTTSRLLVTLMNHEMIFNLHSETENENLASELFTLFRRVRNDDFNYELYRALFRLVIKKASNFDIWNAVFDLIRFIFRIISSTSISVSFDNTLITHFFVSQQDDEQTYQLLKARVFEKIKNCTYWNVEEFFSKYFEDKAWTERIKKIYRVVQDRHVNDRWIDFSDSSMQNAVLEWLFQFQEKFLINALDVYYTSKSSWQIENNKFNV